MNIEEKIIEVKKDTPTSPGTRGRVRIVNPNLHKGKPHASLVKSKKKNSSGRNNSGKITVRHRGGGHKRRYREVDFKRNKENIPAVVLREEYDPNRTANIALIRYADGEHAYILAPKGLKAGSQVIAGKEVPISVGNCLPLNSIPLGTFICCVEEKVGKGAQLARSAGCYAQLLAKEGTKATLRLKSGEMKRVPLECRAVIGVIGNSEHNLKKLGKAGVARRLNRRPTVRGVAMNPVDHPLGGGEGRTSGGRPSCSPWGKPEGVRTRSKKKRSNKLIVRSRHKGKGGSKK